MEKEREMLLLGVLRQQEMHGYQLHEFIDSNLAACSDLKKSTAYYLLDKMAGAGWVVFEQEQEGNRPPRRVYRLTAEGEAAFQALLRANLGGYQPGRFAGETSLAFIDALEPPEQLRLLQQRRAATVAELDALRRAPEHAGGIQLILDHQMHHLSAEVDWLDRLIARLIDRIQSAPARPSVSRAGLGSAHH